MSQDFLDQVERQLVEATERGAKRRRFWHLRLSLRLRVPTFALAAVAVTAVTATALAAELGLPAVTRHRPTTAQTTTTGTQVAAGFDPQSFTAIGEFTWWLLGTGSCGSSTCPAIARTEDGGRTFTWLPAPTGVQQLRFANAEDGYAFAPELWSTDDGGATWNQVELGGIVDELMASGEYVYAIVLPAGGGGGKLMRSTVGSDDWTTLTAASNLQASLWVQDQYVLAESAGQRGDQLLVSDDYGASFAVHPAPRAVVCDFEWASASVIWEPCATGTMSGIWRSTDGGATYAPIGGDATNRGPQYPSSMAFGAASPEVAVMGFRRLYLTVDGGRTYRPSLAPTATQWSYVGFTDGTHGVAIGIFVHGAEEQWRLYYTINAGASYHYVPIDPT